MPRKDQILRAVAQGVIFGVELLTYFLLAWKFENRWIIWSLTTLAWNIVHCSDALITTTFNKEFRRLVYSPFRRYYGASSAFVHPSVSVSPAAS
ncbi:hypothetical protein ANCCAN_21828 [Ancylostoma caninum]|uniref:7TM GPCR serpentine receptor class x (Srx) domain-containing protein n=1 Tax=Ancylostoma caninum TaxID=29170 RepID=A0A368FJD7_ANCCA|nr:hypothetical protein ANCCAN_21828 [Ancylostoma caninum]